jgi:hypothetical protein
MLQKSMRNIRIKSSGFIVCETSVPSANTTSALVYPNGDWRDCIDYAYSISPIHQLTLVSGLKQDPMITDDVPNSSKEWSKYSSSFGYA